MIARTELVSKWLAELDRWGLDRSRTISTWMIEEAIDESPNLWPKDDLGYLDFDKLKSINYDLCEIAILNNHLIEGAFNELNGDYLTKSSH